MWTVRRRRDRGAETPEHCSHVRTRHRSAKNSARATTQWCGHAERDRVQCARESAVRDLACTMTITHQFRQSIRQLALRRLDELPERAFSLPKQHEWDGSR